MLPDTRSFGAGPIGGGVVAVGDGLALEGLAVGVVTDPVQAVQLSANDAGARFGALHEPPSPDGDGPAGAQDPRRLDLRVAKGGRWPGHRDTIRRLHLTSQLTARHPGGTTGAIVASAAC